MNILAIDSTADNLIVAVIQQKTEYVNVLCKQRNQTSATLCGYVDEVLSRAGITFDEVDAYACNIGPGSFTGIRIGVATVKGYQLAKPRRLIAIGSLYMLAHGNGRAIIDAGNGYYYARYRCKRVVEEPQLVGYDDKRAKGASTFTNVAEHTKKLVRAVREAYKKGDFVDTLSPIYIRRSQAEENRDKNS